MNESSSPIECQIKAQLEVMKITVGSEEEKCFSRIPAQVNNVNGVGS